MNVNDGLQLVAPQITPVLDPWFRPAILANHAYCEQVANADRPEPVAIALEQADGSVFHYSAALLPSDQESASGNYRYIERLVKFLLWSRGGRTVHFAGPEAIARKLREHFDHAPTGQFDSDLIGRRVYDSPIRVLATDLRSLPPEQARTQPLGRHLDGCRIGFDLGGSDRKVAAIKDGKVVFSEETVWDPYHQPDPDYHLEGILESLRRAAGHLPRVDAIGGSAAGVYVNNRVKVASLFRGVPQDVFNHRVKDIFLEVQQQMGGVPLDVANDGEVTALAGSMSLGVNGVLGIAMGTSQAAGYVTPEGNITTWLNELAFAPVDYNPKAPRDEWSGDYGVGAQYFSQQAVGRLMDVAGIETADGMPLPERLKHVQALMNEGDPRALKIYQTIGTYLGYGIAHYADFYDFSHVLVLGRVTSGPGGDVILKGAREVLKAEFPELDEHVQFHVPDEMDKRHGQAVAAASLPRIG